MKILLKSNLILIAMSVTMITCSKGPRSLAFQDKEMVNSKLIERLLNQMSLDEKIGQMMTVHFHGRFFNSADPTFHKRIEKQIVESKVGGFIIYGGNVYETAHLINRMQRLSKLPLLIASDVEWGAGQQIRGAVVFPTLMAIGATGNEEYAYLAGKITAEECRALGIHQAYAPVMDVNNNPENPIINVRSFGQTPEGVSKLGKAFIRGLQENGVLATAKHFPGHGNTRLDSHIEMPTIYSDLDSLKKVEFYPFGKAIQADVAAIMTAHIAVPALDRTPNRPATLSPKVITGLLRKKMGFGGLIITDSMMMGGITRGHAVVKATVGAVKAGTDIILVPPDPELAIRALVAAVKRGEISEERIDESVRRILGVKDRLGLFKHRLVEIDPLPGAIGSPENWGVARRIAEGAVTLVKNGESLMPLTLPDSVRVLCLTLNSDPRRTTLGAPFRKALQARVDSVKLAIIDDRTDEEEFGGLLDFAKGMDAIIAGAFVEVRAYKGTVAMEEKQAQFVERLLNLGKPFILASFGSPYLIRQFPDVPVYLCSYSKDEWSQIAAVEAIFGEIEVNGKLPVSIPGYFPLGHGIHLPKTERLAFFPMLREVEPKRAKFSPARLDSLVKVVEEAITDTAFPGAALLVARSGKVVFNRGFGHFRYDPASPPVIPNTMFDLASVTKVAATTTAIMILYDRGMLDLDHRVADYLLEFGQQGKERITIRHILTHTSGLTAWVPLFDSCKGKDEVKEKIFGMELEYRTGKKTIYSDLGMITIGLVIEKISGMPLDQFCREEIYEPLGMTHTMFNPPKELWDQIAPTEDSPQWGRVMQGEVHDQNAYVMGGVAGHAGLFSTAGDMAILLQMILNGGYYNGRRFFSPETVELFTERANLVEESSRALGWDTRSEPASTGAYFTDETFGHLGFTGTSVWVDPERQLLVVLLTNRVYPSRENIKIRQVRPRVHDAVMGALLK